MLASVLPAPKYTSKSTSSGSNKNNNNYENDDKNDEDKEAIIASVSSSSVRKGPSIPSYPNRRGFIPVNIEDFGDGGAYPEIHVVQYPLNMGKPGMKSSAVVAVDVDEKGQVRFDAIVKQGTNKNKIVQSTLNDLKEKKGNEDSLALPTEDEEVTATEKTKKALEDLLNGKISASRPLDAAHVKEGEAQFIRYTPNPNAPGYNPATQQRVIKMVEAQVDPMEPPKHPLKKVSRGPPEDPVPVLHSPPRKLTIADQQAWKIPPAISNWKNSKGFIIPLDKRLAADGRGLQEITINNKFATLSEALYVAERKAAEDLRIRNQIRKKMSIQEKEEKEKELREMAAKARMERAGISGGNSDHAIGRERSYYEAPESSTRNLSYDDDNNDNDNDSNNGNGDNKDSNNDDRHRGYRIRTNGRDNDGNNKDYDKDGKSSRSREDRRRVDSDDDSDRNSSEEEGEHNDNNNNDDEGKEEPDEDETEAERRDRLEREKLRVQRRKERERELRLENMKGNMRKSKIDREESRDISEKIALGLHKGTGKLTGESMFDSRLFNQSAGISGGFGNEDEYNAFSKPLFDRGEAGSIYRPKKSDSDIYGDADTQLAKLSDTSKFKPDKGFKGAEGGISGGGRDAPVQFERVREDNDRESNSSKRSRYE